MTERFSTSITVNSWPSKVWATLTYHQLMSEWLGNPEMYIEVRTDWKINSPIFIRGFHQVNFEIMGNMMHLKVPSKNQKLLYLKIGE